jgi:DNA-binding transcriptional regulator GbsR (MarR family)
MQIGEDWKINALGTVPPWLALGLYNDLIKGIAQIVSKSFSIQKIRKELSSEAIDTNSIDKYDVQQQRLLRILPKAVEILVESGLLARNKNQLLGKGDDFEAFFDFAEGVQANVEKAIRWAVYYVMARGHSSFASEEVANVLVPPQSEMAEVVDKLALLTKDHYVRLLQQYNGKWKITERVRLPHRSPSIIEDVYEKLVYAVCVIAKSGKNQIDTSEIIAQVRSLDVENVERFLYRLRFVKKKDTWQLPPNVHTPQMLIHKIESSTRLPAGYASDQCLRLLDSMNLSVTEIASLTTIDKSTISRALKRLKEENWIAHSVEKGPFGEEYYTTNCSKCYSQKEIGQCQKETIDQIKEMLSPLQLDTSKADFKRFPNQALNRIRDHLLQMKTEKTSKQRVQELDWIWSALLEPKFTKIIKKIEVRFTRMASKESWPSMEQVYKVIDEEGENLPLLYRLGIRHTLNSPQVKHALELYSKEKIMAKHPPKK